MVPLFLCPNMEPEQYFTDTPDIPPDATTPVDATEGTETIMEVSANYAEDAEIVTETKKRIQTLFSAIRYRESVQDIWTKNDKMYRVKPDSSIDEKHRANESTGVYHISVNQLVSMAFKTMTDNPENYKFGFRGVMDDDAANQIRAKNAEIMTLLLRRAQSGMDFKRNLKRILLDVYKYGNAFAGIPWEKRVLDLSYRDKETGEIKTKSFVKNNLPGLEFMPIGSVFVDENIDEIEAQPMVAIKSPISWSKLYDDSKKQKVTLFKEEGGEGIRQKFSKYLISTPNAEFDNPQLDRIDNAGRDYQNGTGERYEHWVLWVTMPINKDARKWDENGPEIRCRVRIVGNPASCEVVEIRENIFPGGVPVLVAHQTEDDIGIYHISSGEKVETYFDQICIGVNQLIDNRSKNTRRPIVYDPMKIEIDKYDFGHSNAVPCNGDVRSAFVEVQLTDMTATIMQTIQYCEQKIKEIMNTTDAVVGQAMGGRTSASEYMGAKVAATTPIFSDMASIEDAIIGEYMRRFAQYIHTFMTHEDIVAQIGLVGAEFQFDLNDIYLIELHGVSEAMERAEKIANLMQIYGMSQDAGAKAKIMLRIAQAMGIENPAEFVSIPAKDQAIKAALWENNEMLIFGQWDDPEMGELHDIHLPIHKQALWQAQRDKSPNVPLMVQHVSTTEQLKRSEQAGGAGPIPAIGQQAGQSASMPGQEAGQQISSEMGNMQAGSPVPAQPPGPPEIPAQ